MHASSYILKLQIDDVILDGCGQACPGILREAIKTWRRSIQLQLFLRSSFRLARHENESTTNDSNG